MLRSEHSIVEYDFATMTARPDRLRHGRDDAYLTAIHDCLSMYRNGLGQRRQDLHVAVAERLESLLTCPPRRIASFCKLLDDAATYDNPGRSAVTLRKRFFQTAAPLHPVVSTREGIFEHQLTSVRQTISEQLGMSWEAIESELFSDVIELQKLSVFPDDLTAAVVLSRYNVAQTQAALYRATRIRLDAYSDFKTIVGRAKLAGLMHHIDKLERPRRGYRFLFDGPGSVLRSTTRYGVGFARLLASLLNCSDWRLDADLVGPAGNRFRCTVTSRDGLKPVDPVDDEFDSTLEQQVQSVWQANPLDGWSLEHETELLMSGQTVMTPDFVLRHDDGRMIYLEVVGYWTPEYLAEKTRRLMKFRSINHGAWLLLFPSKKSTTASDLSKSVRMPYLIFNKHSQPADWIAAALQ